MDGKYREITTWEPFEAARNCWEEDSEPGSKTGWSSLKDKRFTSKKEVGRKVSKEEKDTIDKSKGPVF